MTIDDAVMRWALTKPGLQGTIGRSVALLTFTGRRSGKTYTIPVSYHREDGTVILVTKRQRKWWHNFETAADVELRLAGKMYTGTAEVMTDHTETLEFMTRYWEKRPIDARAHGLKKDQITRDHIAGILPHIVVIGIAVTPVE